jgi:Fe-Mn family superoxide dismutase
MSQAQPFELPALPWDPTDLQPVISSETISFHYGKHHAAYVAKLNEFAGTNKALAGLSLEQVIKETHGVAEHQAVFNNAAQIWNHTFYWESLAAKRSTPSTKLAQQIEKDFGDMAKLEAALKNAGIGQFGSGWAWLTYDNGRLRVEATGNAGTPMATGKHCLLTLDVWEHAYYLDYQNRRPDYLDALIKGRLDWSRASKRFEAAAN